MEVLEKVVMTSGAGEHCLCIPCQCPDDRCALGAGRRLPLRKPRSPDHAHEEDRKWIPPAQGPSS